MAPLPTRPPIRKALFVGIQYEGSRNADNIQLMCPHRDVRDFKQFVVSTFVYLFGWPSLYEILAGVLDEYGYFEENITIMLDDEDTPEVLRPTRQNLVCVMWVWRP